MNFPRLLCCLAMMFPLTSLHAEWKWDDDLIPDLGFDLDAARVIKVTNLNAKGKGSLANALWAEGPRIVVFEVGGVIDLGMKELSMKNPQLVIAGQTAPGPGITLIRGGISVAASQTLIQHLAVRPGDAGQAVGSGWEPDGFTTLGNAHDVWIDHCSFTWSIDENMSASSYEAPPGTFARRIYFRDCIIAQGLNLSSHKKGPHSKGTLIMDGTQEVGIVRCLYAANVERNPVFKPDTSGVVVNCLIAGAGQRALHATAPAAGTDAKLAQVATAGNVVLFAPHTKKVGAILEGPANWFAKDNIGKNADGEEIPQIRTGEITATEPPVWPAGLKPMPAVDVVAYIAANVGARPAQRDPIDARIVKESVEAKIEIIDSQEQVGGYPKPEPVTRQLDVPETGRREWLRKLSRELIEKR